MNTLPYGDISQNINTLTSGVSGAIGLAEGKGSQSGYDVQNALSTFGANLAKERIPASGFLNFITKVMGGNVKDTGSDNKNPVMAGIESAKNKVIAGIPVVGNSDILPDKLNSFGETISKPNLVESLLGATNPSISESDKLTGITPVGSKDLNSVAIENLTTVDDKTAYNNVIKRLEDAGDRVTNTNVFKELVKDKNYILAAKYDKKINKTIDDNDKVALAKFDALDEEHQKVYLEDSQNAFDTYSAQLNNKQANGTLSKDDKDTYKEWNGTGNSLLVKALVAKTNVENNVSQDVINLYERTTSKKEYNILSDEERAKLDTYISQLNSNGVKARDFSSSSSSSKNYSSSSIPLTKAVTSGTGSTGKFAHQDINVEIPQVIKPEPQYVIKQRKISVS